MFRHIDGYSATPTGMQLGGTEEVSPCPFLKIEENALLILEKEPDCEKKNPKCFPAGLFFLVLLTKCLLKCPSSTKPLLPWKMSGWVPALRHYSFCKTLHAMYCIDMVEKWDPVLGPPGRPQPLRPLPISGTPRTP